MTDSIDVLLVDEDKETLELAATFLERKSPRITTASETDPETAVDRAVDGGFDCVVSDYRMPELDGVELCRAIREREQLPFFLFTAVSASEIEDESVVTGSVRKGAGTEHYDELVERIEAAVP
ncbi:Response regulator receiver domain-containing protein [Halovenus aranensis]|uniref:Response regulator receiver domain-containing protein n=1 Tax=Halovenus aranensis TaxID=890420 RepID=A0A1G8SQD8_9EURY|nr:response regulator [Halovenus aranensis]SDJ31363.1 Response regulator receiver domain-containing protein [Halovenus aranensis]